ncbi:MAG: glycosyltransferase family 4 protein [Candidatus Gottesmanbacteria bacterium]|nr:glycosyltransferase family 4 protein [Candidatus Gottesmanbacteria bacterium]
MHILILNWRDIKNPRAGGAELLTHEIAKRWVAHGHTVTLFSEQYNGAVSDEILDGVNIIRRGVWWSVHLYAMFYYIFRFRKTVDIIVDEVHWYPFFSIFYARHKTVLLVCEVAGSLFFRLLPYPFALLARFIEKIYVLLYRSSPVLAISQSTRAALLREGFDPARITVLPMGVTLPKVATRYPKATTLTMIVVARLQKFKGIADAISAFSRIQAIIPFANLWIVGGDSEGYQKDLERIAKNLGVYGRVKFFGRVTDAKKFELLARAHILLMPSVHEGWGLVVPEAASQGTPAIGYRTAGVQDVIVDGKTGILVGAGYPEKLAEETLNLWGDQPRYRRYQAAGVKRVASMNWDDTARVAFLVLRQTHEK